jgi:hypothetical protein
MTLYWRGRGVRLYLPFRANQIGFRFVGLEAWISGGDKLAAAVLTWGPTDPTTPMGRLVRLYLGRQP